MFWIVYFNSDAIDFDDEFEADVFYLHCVELGIAPLMRVYQLED